MTDFLLKITACVSECIAHHPPDGFGVDVVFACSMFPCMQRIPYPSSLCCALEKQPDLGRKLCLRNLIKRSISAQACWKWGNTLVQGALCRASALRGAAAGHRQRTLGCPSPHAEGSGCQGMPGQSWCLAWTYILPLAGTDQQGVFIVDTAVLLWSVSKRQKQEEDQKSCALLWKFLHGCTSSPTGP